LLRVVDCATADTRRLYCGPDPVTPPDLRVRALVGELAGEPVVTGTASESWEQHLFQICTRNGTVRQLTDGAGWHSGQAAGTTLLIMSESPGRVGARWDVQSGGTTATIANLSELPPVTAHPILARAGRRRIPTAVLFPRHHRPGERLPVLVHSYAGPGQQEVRAARDNWLSRQWWADQGVAVVTIDGRGTPGVGPRWEKALADGMADVVLDDQVTALTAVAEDHPDLDLTRVAIRGWSFGGFVAALAVLQRPDVFHAAVAGAPVTDWMQYSSAYTERYLGPPTAAGYPESSLLGATPDIRRPLMIVYGTRDENVLPVHALRLSAQLLRTRHPHTVLALPGERHVPSADCGAALLPAERDFLFAALGHVRMDPCET
jgi:dipeptidyl-peptidase-4